MELILHRNLTLSDYHAISNWSKIYYMRIKIFLYISLVLVITMGSCKKNLEEKPYSSLSPASAFADETSLKETTLGIYQSWTSTPFFDVFDRFVLSECGHQYATAGIYDD